jgi:hypothetical protein
MRSPSQLQRAGFSADDFDVRHQRISAAPLPLHTQETYPEMPNAPFVRHHRIAAVAYKRQRVHLRPSLFWNAYVGWSPTAPASRLIIPGVLSLRANRLLARPSFRKGTVDVIDEKVRRPTVTGIAARLAITALRTRNVAIAPLLALSRRFRDRSVDP